jgi:hypothetical protein
VPKNGLIYEPLSERRIVVEIKKLFSNKELMPFLHELVQVSYFTKIHPL